MPDDIYLRLQQALVQQGPAQVFKTLAEELKAAGRFHELFDARLMEARHRLGIPLQGGKTLDELEEPLRTQMEDAYLAACREVGRLLVHAGKLREGWMYLRPVGDRAEAAAAIAKITPDDGNYEEIIEIAVHEGVAPALGFPLILERYGTCNAITTYEGALRGRPLADRQQVAAMLVRRVYDELRESLRHEIKRQEGTFPAEETVAALIADRDWLFADGAYHIDTSHLNSVVRFAEIITDPAVLDLAEQLTQYGKQLGPQFQFKGEEPFADPYVSHGLFFQAQLGKHVEEALAYFRERANLDVEQHGTGPREVYIALLHRLDRHAEAQAAAEELPRQAQPLGFAPTMLELARAAGGYARLMEFARRREDVLSFTAGLVESQSVSQA